MTPVPEERPLTELQLAHLRALWRRGEATVVEIHDDLIAEGRELASQSVATILSRLVKRGVVAFRKAGRTHVYRATVAEEDVRAGHLAGVADELFAGDLSTIVQTWLDRREVGTGDLARVRALIEAKERELGRRKRKKRK